MLERAQSWVDVQAGLAEFGLEVRVNGRGMSITDGRQVVKASERGPQYSRGNLEEEFGRYSDYRARVAVASAISIRDARGASPAPVGIESKAQPERRTAPEAQPRFSLYDHLVARLGSYPDPHLRATAAEVAPAPPASAVQPETPRQHVKLPEPQAPAAASGEREEIADAPRFTLFDDEGVFGVYDTAGPEVFFAETRERALEEVERANHVVALYPNTISMRHLREMDGAWRDARGLPRLPEPEGPIIPVPWPTRVPAEVAPASIADAGTASAHEISAPASTVERAAEQFDALEPPPPTEPVREEVPIHQDIQEPKAHRAPDRREVQARRSSSHTVDSSPEDPAVAEAVRTFVALEDAHEAVAQARQLREERRLAEEVLAKLDNNEKALERTRRDFRVTAAKVYRDPAAAMAAWDALVHRASGNLEAAGEQVKKNPHILGPLLTDPPSSVWDSAREMVGFGSTRMAREAVPQMLHRAALHTPALREATKSVEWTAPDGTKVGGREKVRSVATDIVGDRSARIKGIEEWVQEFGGIAGAEREVQRAFAHLSSVQRSQAARKIGAATGITEASVAAKITEVLGKAHRAARLARSLGEGPGGL